MKKSVLRVSLVLAICCLVFTAVAMADTPSIIYAPQSDNSVFDSPETLAEYVQIRTDRDANSGTIFAATVKTLENGIKVQSVPNDVRCWNVGILHAEDRGCTVCHRLEDTLEWLPIAHNGVKSIGSDAVGVETCLNCHTGRQVPIFNRPIPLENGVHAIHMSSSMFTGNCFSCHYVNEKGEYEMWDRVKYDLYQGLTLVSNVEGEFSYDQDVITPNNEVYYMLAANTNPNGIALYSDGDASILENWVVEVGSGVENSISLKIADIPEDQLISRVMKSNCKVAGVGDGLICNVEVKGLPFSTLLEMVKPLETSTVVTFHAADGGNPNYEVQWLLDHDAMLVFYMNGERLPAELGYPCALWMTGVSAGPMRKYIKGCDFCTPADVDEYEDDTPGTQIVGDEENFYNKPVFAVLNTVDGQIFEAGKPITFEGYVDAFDELVASMEFSLDRGKTWTKFDIENTVQEKWVYWYFTYTPEKAGSYVMRIRATSDTGRVSYRDLNLLFHAE